MKILILSQYFPPEVGAAQVRLGAFAEALQASGHEVSVITALPNYPTGRIFEGYRGRLSDKRDWKGIPVSRYWMLAGLGKGFKRLLGYLSFALTAIGGVLRAGKHDVVFAESPPFFIAIAARLFAWRHRAVLVFNVADLWPDSLVAWGTLRPNGFLFRLFVGFEQWIYRRSNLVTGATEGILESLITQKGVERAKVFLLPNGVSTNPAGPEEEAEAAALFDRLGESNSVSWFIYAGTHGYAHGLEQLIEAAALLEERGSTARFLLIGDGSTKSAIQEFASQKKLKSVHFHPPVQPDVLKPLFRRSVAGVSTLRDDPFFRGTRPAKIFPMMAAGLPIIYAGQGEGADLITACDGGWVVPPERPIELAAAVEEALREPSLAKARGDRGRTRVYSDLSWEAIVQRWVAVVEPAVDKHRGLS